MSYNARKLEYFYVTVNGEAGEAFELLTNLANLGINFLAITSVPVGPGSVQLSLFPAEPARFLSVARASNLALNGPHAAVLVQGADEVGVLAGIHDRLRDAAIDVYASTGVTDGKGHFGYLLYLKPHESERAVEALSMVGVRA
jgi:hypothetical protein